MEPSEVQALVAAEFPEADIQVSQSGGHYTIAVVDAGFEGVRSVARQQRVYAPLRDIIAAGTIHAVNIIAKTPAEAGA